MLAGIKPRAGNEIALGPGCGKITPDFLAGIKGLLAQLASKGRKTKVAATFVDLELVLVGAGVLAELKRVESLGFSVAGNL